MNPVSWMRLCRPKNCLMAGIAAAIGYFVSAGYFLPTVQYPLVFLSVFLICAGGQAINDYYDFEVDKRKGRAKFVESERKSVLAFSALLFLAGIAFSSLLSMQSLAIAVSFSVLLFLYSAFMQGMKFIGNYVVALGTGFSIIFGASVTGNYFLAGIFAIAAIFANLSREIIKDLEDMDSDMGYKKTLPLVAGVKNAKWFAAAYAAMAILVSFVPYVALLTGKIYLLPVIVSFYFLFNSIDLTFKDKFAGAQKNSKYAMMAALVAFALYWA